jgi:hypothetical protein
MRLELDRILSNEHRQHGMQLVEHAQTAILFQRGEPVAHWPAREVTIAEILKEADSRLPERDAIKELAGCGGIEVGKRIPVNNGK